MDVMIDLETWGTRPTSKLRSIGAVWFDPNESNSFSELLQDAFYANVDCGLYDYGDTFTTDAATASWWDRQTAAQAIFAAAEHRPLAADNAITWLFDELGATWRNLNHVWANSPTFDCAMLRHHAAQFCYQVPWEYYQEMDVRTLRALLLPKRAGRATPAGFIKHRADHDAALQAMDVQRALHAHAITLR